MTKDKIKLFIVDQDSIYRLGLRTAISQYEGFAVIGEGSINNDTWRELTQGLVINVLVVGISNEDADSWEFCLQLKQLYPQLPLFLLTPSYGKKKLAHIRAMGIQGYCDHHNSINTIVEGIHTIAYGGNYWPDNNLARPRIWQTALSRISKSGRVELEREINQINAKLSSPNLSDWEKVFLVGRKRELLTARWLSNRLVAEEIILDDQDLDSTTTSQSSKLILSNTTELAPIPVFEDSANKTIFERVVTDIQISLTNRSKIPLEIDILRLPVQKSLCHIILKRLSETIKQVPIANTLDQNYETYLTSIWSWATCNFFEQHYGELNLEETARLQNIITQESTIIQQNIFQYIYGVSELFAYLLGTPGLRIDNISYQSDDPEAIAQIELILHNLIIQLANGVMQVILNNFYDLELFKYQLYKSEYKSDRALARFRNQLSWRYRQAKYFDHPQNIFESRYRLFVLNNGIRTTWVYAPRKSELERLSGLPWITTIVIEIRDAIAPLVKQIIAFTGSGVVFVLTQVIGKALGLIGRGIIQGVGSTIKDVKPKK